MTDRKLPIFKERFCRLVCDRANNSQAEFARLVGISKANINSYFKGEKVPDAATMIKIAQKCNVSVDWLLGLSGMPTAVPGMKHLQTDKSLRWLANKSGLHENTILLLESIEKVAAEGDEGYVEYAKAVDAAIGMREGKCVTGDNNQTFLHQLAILKQTYTEITAEMERANSKKKITPQEAATLYDAVIQGGDYVAQRCTHVAELAKIQITEIYRTFRNDLKPDETASESIKELYRVTGETVAKLYARSMLPLEPAEEYKSYYKAMCAEISEMADETDMKTMERFFNETERAVAEYRTYSQAERFFKTGEFPGIASLQWDIARVKMQTENFIDEYLGSIVKRFNVAVWALMEKTDGLASATKLHTLIERSDIRGHS